MYRCPKCGGRSVRVLATTVVDLYGGDEEVPMGAEPSYDDTSRAECLTGDDVVGDDGKTYSCDFSGTLIDFTENGCMPSEAIYIVDEHLLARFMEWLQREGWIKEDLLDQAVDITVSDFAHEDAMGA